MSSPFVAEIRIFPFNFAPRGWAFCNGQILPISQNTALFSLLGTTYGGDGRSTFALPDLQGAGPIHEGQGPGLSQYFLGQQGGSQNVTLIQTEMPSHNHTLSTATGDSGTTDQPTNALLATSETARPLRTTSNAQMNLQTLSIAGSSLPHNNMQPYLTLNFCIALQGIFPPRG